MFGPFFSSLYYFPSVACSLISDLKTFLTEHRAFISILKLSFHSFLSCFIPSTMFISTLSYQSFYFPLFPSLLHLILFFLLSFFYPTLITSPSFYFSYLGICNYYASFLPLSLHTILRLTFLRLHVLLSFAVSDRNSNAVTYPGQPSPNWLAKCLESNADANYWNAVASQSP